MNSRKECISSNYCLKDLLENTGVLIKGCTAPMFYDYYHNSCNNCYVDGCSQCNYYGNLCKTCSSGFTFKKKLTIINVDVGICINNSFFTNFDQEIVIYVGVLNESEIIDKTIDSSKIVGDGTYSNPFNDFYLSILLSQNLENERKNLIISIKIMKTANGLFILYKEIDTYLVNDF